MRKAIAFAVVGIATLAMGCMDRPPAPVCPVPTELNSTEAQVSSWEGVDMLVVVDNSGSMAQEQAILATAFFPLVNSLANPAQSLGQTWDAAENVRVAVVSSDLGLSYGGHDYDLDPSLLETFKCTDNGDDGTFRTYTTGKTINIKTGQIKCETEAQCPAGWSCTEAKCQPASGDGTAQTCPDLNANFAETTGDAANPNLAFQVACLSNLGTNGCGFEQQLQASVRGLNKNSNFIRDNMLLAVLIVSDEEDCSLQDAEFFATEEMTNLELKKSNIACNFAGGAENEEYLYPTDSYFTSLVQLKGGSSQAVIFASIVGVPRDGYDANGDPSDGYESPCEGAGNKISQCLDEAAMAYVPQEETSGSSGQTYIHFRPACERYEGEVNVTSARPGRRYVKLAQKFGEMGYIYSICNQNWDPAMEQIGKLIAQQLGGTCYTKPLDWDPITQAPRCDVVVEFPNSGEDFDCPWTLGEGQEKTVAESVDDNDVQTYTTYCPLPKLAADLSCTAAEEQISDSDFGWYYCEDSRENFEEACADGIDNDGQNGADCDDPACESCKDACGGNGANCAKSCKYNVRVTNSAKAMVGQRTLAVQCLQQFSFEDENCQENTNASCNDGKDNDGNGIWDCRYNPEEEGDNNHLADPNCCPMTKNSNGTCEVDTARTSANCGAGAPAAIEACQRAASALSCTL